MSANEEDRMKIGVNLEYVRHADKSLTYGVQTAGKMGYKWVEPCFLMGRCLLSNAGYCHVTSLDTDPQQILDLCAQAGVKISGLSSHSDLLNPEWGVLYAAPRHSLRPGIGCEDRPDHRGHVSAEMDDRRRCLRGHARSTCERSSKRARKTACRLPSNNTGRTRLRSVA